MSAISAAGASSKTTRRSTVRMTMRSIGRVPSAPTGSPST